MYYTVRILEKNFKKSNDYNLVTYVKFEPIIVNAG